jgi:3-phosphoshikimate 1-carboxyvinyltransferase
MILRSAERIEGTVRVPGDKSIAHRALILGAVARGKQVVDGVPRGADVRHTTECLRTLGTFAEEMPDGRYLILSKPLSGGQRLDAGNSGTTARLLSGLVAGHDIESTIDGDASLKRRPMARIAEPLASMGASIATTNGRLPMTIKGGGLHGITYDMPIASAQVKSALLIAGLFAEGRTTVVEPAPSRDHTERMLRAMGVPVESTEGKISIDGPVSPKATVIRIPGDISSAAFLIVATICLHDSEIYLPSIGVNETRSGVLEVLTAMGANVEVVNRDTYLEEPVGDIIAKSSTLHGVRVEPDMVPTMIDELPVLALAATQAEGETVVTGAAELRHKESDRITSIVTNLTALGATIEARDDGFVVRGPTPLHGAKVNSHGDHRMAMTLAVAAFIADGTTDITSANAIDVSYPGFFEDVSTVLR